MSLVKASFLNKNLKVINTFTSIKRNINDLKKLIIENILKSPENYINLDLSSNILYFTNINTELINILIDKNILVKKNNSIIYNTGILNTNVFTYNIGYDSFLNGTNYHTDGMFDKGLSNYMQLIVDLEKDIIFINHVLDKLENVNKFI